MSPPTPQGTLIVKGNLIINGTNVRITAQPGLPALIVTGDIDMTGGPLLSLAEMRVAGLTWVGGRIYSIGTGTPRLEIEGSLIVAGAQPLFTNSPLARFDLRRPPAGSDTPVMGITDTASTVKVIEWW